MLAHEWEAGMREGITVEVSAADRAHLQQELHGTTRERMLREMAEALEGTLQGLVAIGLRGARERVQEVLAGVLPRPAGIALGRILPPQDSRLAEWEACLEPGGGQWVMEVIEEVRPVVRVHRACSNPISERVLVDRREKSLGKSQRFPEE